MRSRSRRSARAIVLRLQVLRHRVGLRQRPERAAARPRRGDAIRTRRCRIATKIPPKNMRWPARGDDAGRRRLSRRPHPRVHREEPAKPRRRTTIDLQQFHVWSDTWADDEEWQRGVRDAEGRRARSGVRHQRESLASRPTCCGRSKTGLVDSVQVVYNIFDQAPEDELFPYCQANGIAVIARVPFDEGSLTGTLTPDSTLAGGRLAQHVLLTPRTCARPCPGRAARPLLPEGMDLPELALRFILEHPAVSDDHSRDAAPGARRAESGRQRRRQAAAQAARRASDATGGTGSRMSLRSAAGLNRRTRRRRRNLTGPGM